MNKILTVTLVGALAVGLGAGVAADESQPVPSSTEMKATSVELSASNIRELSSSVLLDIPDTEDDTDLTEAEDLAIDISDESEIEADDETESISVEDDDYLSVEERIKRNSESNDVWYHIEKWECPGHQWESDYEVDDAGTIHYSRDCTICGSVEDLDYCPNDLEWTKDIYSCTASSDDSDGSDDFDESELDSASSEESYTVLLDSENPDLTDNE